MLFPCASLMGKRKARTTDDATRVATTTRSAAGVGTADDAAAKRPTNPPLPPPHPTREEQVAAWNALVVRLRDTPGGFIHDGVGIGFGDDDGDGGGGGGGGRGLVATGEISAGDAIFRVPAQCTVTAAAALRSSVGRRVTAAAAEAAAAAAAAADPNPTTTTTASSSPHLPPSALSSPPRLALGDLALAAFVAVDVLNPSSPHAPYYRLLDAEPFDESPAWWPPSERDVLLAGSHVRDDAVKLAEDVRHDFERFVRGAICGGGSSGGAGAGAGVRDDDYDDDGGFERFRRAVAAIHSRSFNTASGVGSDGGGGTCEDEAAGGALVPLLDCANHFRKPRETAWSTVDEPGGGGGVDEDGGDGGVNSGSGDSKTIVVTALRRFAPG